MSNLARARAALKKNKNVDFKNRVELDPNNTEPIPAMSTGSLVMDYLIGGNKLPNGQAQCPGIPRGRITEIYGPEGSGKCVTSDTVVSTVFGLTTIEELFRRKGYDLSEEPAEEECESFLLNENGKMEKTSHFTWNGRQDVFRFQNDRGMEIAVTPNHPLRVVETTGYITWRHAEDIKEGDYVIVQYGGRAFGDEEIPFEEARALAYAMNAEREGSRNFFESSEEALREDFTACLTFMYDAQPKTKGSVVEYGPNVQSVIEDRFGLLDEVPFIVRQSTENVQRQFLRAFVESGGVVEPAKATITVSHGEIKTLRHVQMMLNNFGILSTLEEDKAQLEIAGRGYVGYAEKVGFITEKLKQASRDMTSQKFPEGEEEIPYMGRLLSKLYASVGEEVTYGEHATYNEVSRALEDLGERGNAETWFYRDYLQARNRQRQMYAFSKITSKTLEKDVPTFDVCLPETHSFWSNGFISHNTTVALETAVQCQKEGGTVCFLDYENAIAPAYAQSLGIDFSEDKWDLYSPNTWEEGAEIIKIMVNAGVDLIIVDSVSAMVPQATFEKDPSEAGQIGLLARLQSRFLPHLVQDLRRSGTALIYLNQMRSRIKTSRYDTGPDEDTSGGRALKYYASLRLKLQRVRTEYSQVDNDLTGDNEKQPIYNVVRAECIKNKVSMHQGHRATFVLRYGEGIDNVHSIMSIAENRKMIRRAGSWYKLVDSYGEEQSLQGMENLRNYYLDNEDQFMHLVNSISTLSGTGGEENIGADETYEEEE